MTSVEAQAEGDLDELTLLVADNSTSYFGVTHRTGRRIAKPYHAQVMRGGRLVHLGNFATAEEAALCVARSPEGRAAAAGSGAVGGESGKALSLPREFMTTGDFALLQPEEWDAMLQVDTRSI
eukprot:scaffold120152_cov66-Phaeocystis_antarctica.AAC.3